VITEAQYAELAIIVKERKGRLVNLPNVVGDDKSTKSHDSDTDDDDDNCVEVGRWSTKVRHLLRELSNARKEDLKEGKWLPLTNRVGDMLVKFEFLPVAVELAQEESITNSGTLSVDLLDARNLKAVDSSGTSDPYVVFTVNGARVYKSEVIKKNLNPVFNESFEIDLAGRHASTLTAEVMDWNALQTHESIGRVSISLADLNPETSVEKRFPLVGGDKDSYVRLRLLFDPCAGQAAVRKKSLLNAAATTVTHAPVKAVTGSAKMAFTGTKTVGKMFARTFGIGKDTEQQQQQEVVRPKAASVVVDPSGAETTAVVQSGGSEALNVEKVSQPAATDPFIGPDAAGGSRVRRTSVGAESMDMDLAPEVLTSLVGNDSGATGERGTLMIRVVEAQDLPSADRNGTSDPYVKVSVGKKNIYRTKTIKKTLSPRWNEVVTLPTNGQPLVVTFIVKDWNLISGNSVLCAFAIQVWQRLRPSAGVLQDDAWLISDKAQGRLRVQLELLPEAPSTAHMSTTSLGSPNMQAVPNGNKSHVSLSSPSGSPTVDQYSLNEGTGPESPRHQSRFARALRKIS